MNRSLILLILLLQPIAHAGTHDVAAQVRQAARDASETYQATGLVGLTAESQDCYKRQKFDFYCVDFDVAAGYLDRRFAAAVGIDRDAYFDVAEFLRRAHPLFVRARWSMDTSNKYLQFVDSAAQEEINEAAGGR